MVLLSLEGLCCLVNFLHVALYTLQVPSDNTLLHSISTRTRATHVGNRDLNQSAVLVSLEDFAILLTFYSLHCIRFLVSFLLLIMSFVAVDIMSCCACGCEICELEISYSRL